MAGPSLRSQAYDTIRGWIGSGQLSGGSVTSEIRLSEQLDMSRTPVRAALQQLETEGFLRIVPKHGVLILHASAQRVSDLLELLIALPMFAYEQNKRTRFTDIARIVGDFPLRPAESPNVSDMAVETAAALAPERLARLEAEMWESLIALGQNLEAARLWRTTAERAGWDRNVRRWKAPFLLETRQCLGELLDAINQKPEAAAPDFFPYLLLLKRTWS